MPKHKQPQLDIYRAKRDPSSTPEPFGRMQIPATGKLFVVQQHAARHLHFDLRLEVDGVLKSWAVPKGPSDDPADKRFAVETEDHPLDYADFEGRIPPGNYGAGHVIVWDRGQYTLQDNFADGYAKGKLLFDLHGYKLRGRWTLVRLKTKSRTGKGGYAGKDPGKEWLLIKERDAYTSDRGPTFNHTSVLSGLSVEQLARPAGKQAALRRACAKIKSTHPAKRRKLRPMLASAGEASDRKGWLWELKYDGYRIIAQKQGADITLLTRNGLVISERFPEICQVLAHLPVDTFVMDGEMVVHDPSGRPSFALMQQRARTANTHAIARAAIEQPATYYCFDLMQFEDKDLCDAKLIERKHLLKLLLPEKSALVYSEHFADAGRKTFSAAQAMGMEGVVGKRADSRYQPGRSSDWVKVRNQRSADYIVLGWSPSKSNAADIGSLALGEYRGGALAYVGHTGSGLGQAMRKTLAKRMRTLARKTPPIGKRAAQDIKPTHWLSPKLVVEVAYTEYTPYGHLRHPSVLRIREDKPPQECLSLFDDVQDSAENVPQPEVFAVTVTNPDKVFYPEPGYTKSDLVKYYRAIARWMLPYLDDRPIVLTRYPDGVEGKSFYQRDVPEYVPNWIRREVLWSESTEREIHYFIVRRAEDLAYLANMGTIPIHIWHSRLSDLDKPDWCVLDLDPKAAPFTDVITLALAIGELADEIDLPAYPKTSGASGLHVLLPLAGQLTHEQSRTLGELLARVIVERHPDIATIARSVRARNKKVYVDFMQNGHGQLIAAPFCARAEPAGSVSMPLRWHEVNQGLRNDKYHLGNAVRRMQRLREDPLHPVLTDAPDLAHSLARLTELMADGQT